MEKICVICEEEIKADPDGWDGGHNAAPVAKGKCCGECNVTVVSVARMKQLGYSQKDAVATISEHERQLKNQAFLREWRRK